MATSTLDELKDKLYKAFDDSITRADSYHSSDEARTGGLRNAAELAKAIVVVETRIDERNAEKSGMKLPGKA